MRLVVGILIIIALLGCTGCGSAVHHTAPAITPSTSVPDPVHEMYLRVQDYVRQHPDYRHFFDPRPDGYYRGPNMLRDWSEVADGSGATLNEWRDNYSSFAAAVNRKSGREEFPPRTADGPIFETMTPTTPK